MKAIITGMHGVVAPALARRWTDAGHTVVPWDRSAVPPDNENAIRNFIVSTRPDAFFHIATGSPDWAQAVASVCAEQGIRFLYTSSVSVYAHTQQGPFAINATPEPNDDYGRYKFDCEQRVRAAHPDAHIARLAWQIGTAPGSNNMIDYLTRTQNEQGRIEASRHWYPAVAFLPDTADALARLIEQHPAGVYQLDGNPGLSFFEIVTEINRLHGNPWKITPTDQPVQNNRMIDPQIAMGQITRTFQSG